LYINVTTWQVPASILSLLPMPNLAVLLIFFFFLSSLGVRSILAKDAVGTLEFFVQMIGVAMAIVTGLFAANLAIRPARQI
jgi:hypothetical protein